MFCFAGREFFFLFISCPSAVTQCFVCAWAPGLCLLLKFNLLTLLSYNARQVILTVSLIASKFDLEILIRSKCGLISRTTPIFLKRR